MRERIKVFFCLSFSPFCILRCHFPFYETVYLMSWTLFPCKLNVFLLYSFCCPLFTFVFRYSSYNVLFVSQKYCCLHLSLRLINKMNSVVSQFTYFYIVYVPFLCFYYFSFILCVGMSRKIVSSTFSYLAGIFLGNLRAC